MISVMAVILSVLAIVVPASVGLVGHWFARQAQSRLAQEREQGERRLAQHESEERARLRLDAAMRAGTLFESDGDERPSSAASAAGLLALTQLDHADLAIALLVDLWSIGSITSSEDGGRIAANVAGELEVRVAVADEGNSFQTAVSTETAVLVINAALRAQSSPNAQLIAAELLCRNAHRLDPCQSLHWPAAIDGRWLPDLPPKAKLLVVDALVRMTSTSPATENGLRSLAVRLYGAWDGDPDPRVKGCVGTLILSIIPALRRLTYSDFMQGRELVSIHQIELAAGSASPNPDGFLEKLVRDRAETLREWSLRCDACNFSPGMLATGAN